MVGLLSGLLPKGIVVGRGRVAIEAAGRFQDWVGIGVRALLSLYDITQQFERTRENSLWTFNGRRSGVLHLDSIDVPILKLQAS